MVYYKGNFNTKKREMQCCTTGEFTTVCTAFWFQSIPGYAIIYQLGEAVEKAAKP